MISRTSLSFPPERDPAPPYRRPAGGQLIAGDLGEDRVDVAGRRVDRDHRHPGPLRLDETAADPPGRAAARREDHRRIAKPSGRLAVSSPRPRNQGPSIVAGTLRVPATTDPGLRRMSCALREETARGPGHRGLED